MKFILTFCLLLTYSLNAQVIIGQSQMPKTGDTIRVSVAAPNVNASFILSEVAKRNESTWDFSAIEPQSQQIQSYLTANVTPYAFYFFNKIGQKTADSLGFGPLMFRNIYSFFTSSSSVYKAEGLGYSFNGIPLAANYKDDDEIYNLPMKFNDSVVNTFDFKFSLPVGNLFSLRQIGKRTNVITAWGSLTTPYKTYSNTLLLKSFVDEIDTITSQFGSFPLPRKQLIYKWFSNVDRTPIMEITYNVNGNNLNLGQIVYQDKIRKTPSLINASFTVDKTSGLKSMDTFIFTNITQPNGVSTAWKFTPNNVKYVNGTSASSAVANVVFTQDGKYNVQLTSSIFTFTDDSLAIDLIQIGTGKVLKPTNTLLIYPNPTNGLVYLPANATIISILNTIGQKVPFSLLDNQLTINKSGIFVVSLQLNNTLNSVKIVVN